MFSRNDPSAPKRAPVLIAIPLKKWLVEPTLPLFVISGADMTSEAAMTKLACVLSKEGWSLEEKKNVSLDYCVNRVFQAMKRNLRGEMNAVKRHASWKHSVIATGLAHSPITELVLDSVQLSSDAFQLLKPIAPRLKSLTLLGLDVCRLTSH